jgi:hypothetical protein
MRTKNISSTPDEGMGGFQSCRGTVGKLFRQQGNSRSALGRSFFLSQAVPFEEVRWYPHFWRT